MRLSAVLIVKNEEETLELCLSSVQDFDEIIVCDTGSTDRTIEIAGRYGKVFTDYTWNDNFAEARNHAISKATGDWILSVDADHVIRTDVETIRSECERLELAGVKVGLVKGQSHWREVLFKNDPSIFWVGAVHEHINVASTTKTKVERFCGWSVNHGKDPDRNLRILEANPKTVRSKFYLGKEYLERKDYDNAVYWMREFLKEGKWHPEICEAHLTIARCCWQQQKGNDARASCLLAIGLNPDFKEALLFMAEMTYEPLKLKWLKIANQATNDDVLFIR